MESYIIITLITEIMRASKLNFRGFHANGISRRIKVNRWIGGCVHEHIAEAGLVIALYKAKTQIQSSLGKSHLRLVWRGGLCLYFVSVPIFSMDDVDSDIGWKRKIVLSKLEFRPR